MQEIGFDIIENSTSFITVPVDDVLRLVEKVQNAGMKAKPEVGIQFGAGGTTAASELEAEGTQDPDWAVGRARRYLEAGAYGRIRGHNRKRKILAYGRAGPFVNSLGSKTLCSKRRNQRYFNGTSRTMVRRSICSWITVKLLSLKLYVPASGEQRASGAVC